MNKVHNHNGTIARAKRYCSDDISLIENFDQMMADTTQKWCCHHRREIDENKSRQQLIDEELYFNRPAAELIFMTASEHSKLHGANMSDTTKLKMSDAKKGNKNGVGKHHSEAAKQKIGAAMKGNQNAVGNKNMLGKHHSEVSKQKMSDAKKGKHWYNNGLKQVFCKECPEGYEPGMLKK